MKTTRHAFQRMNQRGITGEMIDIVLHYGEVSQDKAKSTLGKKAAEKVLAHLQQEIKVVKKVLDKGGVVVVVQDDTVITTYNYKQIGR